MLIKNVVLTTFLLLTADSEQIVKPVFLIFFLNLKAPEAQKIETNIQTAT